MTGDTVLRIIAAGTVTFNSKNQVLVIKNTKYREVLFQLPKGRLDLGETSQQGALRETFEETGYRVKLTQASIPTRATRPKDGLTGTKEKPAVGTVDDTSTEPVGMVMGRDALASTAEQEVTKLCFFYLAELVDPDAEPETDTQDEHERLKASWMTVPEAQDKLRFKAEKDALECAYAVHQRAMM